MSSTVKYAPPEVYERHVGRYGPALAREMVRLASLQPGQTALDVGCGPGSLAAALAEVLGAACVAAIDPSGRFVAACHARAPGVDARVGVAEELPFSDTSFDAALAQLVVDGMDDSKQGVAEMRRVTKPGGCVLASVWDFDGGMTLICAVRDAALEFDEQSARSFGAGNRLPFSTAEELEGLWRESILDEIQLGEIEVTASYEDFEDLWLPFAVGIGRFVQSLDDGHRAEFKAQVANRLGNPQGSFDLTARALWVRGRTPSP